MPPSNNGASSARPLEATGGDYNAHAFVVASLLAKIATTSLVKIVAVTNDGGLAPVGFVDAMPLVAQIDGAGNATPHGTIYHVPYLRLQGGANAVILDPQVGDIGIAVFASRDISSVKNTRQATVPGSRRRFDMADALYIGGVLNGEPVQYVRFGADGVEIVSPVAVNIVSPTLTHNGVNIGDTHHHGGVEIGGDFTGGPE